MRIMTMITCVRVVDSRVDNDSNNNNKDVLNIGYARGSPS